MYEGPWWESGSAPSRRLDIGMEEGYCFLEADDVRFRGHPGGPAGRGPKEGSSFKHHIRQTGKSSSAKGQIVGDMSYFRRRKGPYRNMFSDVFVVIFAAGGGLEAAIQRSRRWPGRGVVEDARCENPHNTG